MPANFPLWRNKPLPDAQAMALRTALAREKALQNHLEHQHIEMENEASKEQDIVSSLVACHAASERLPQLLDALRAAVTESKDLLSNTINVHDTEADAADKLTTTTAAKTAWGDLIQLLEALTPQINATITSTQSHTLNAYNQVCTHQFLAECARNSIAALDLSLDAIATNLSFKQHVNNPIFRIPNEVFQLVFQLVVEEERDQLRAQFSSSSFSSYCITLDEMRRTIPICPFTLAAVCRGWRNVALHTPKLWSYIRVHTSFGREGGTPAKYCWVGKAAFETSLQRAKGAPLELAIYQDPFQLIQTIPHIPPDARVSIIYLVQTGLVPTWLPSCSHLYLFGREESKSGYWNEPIYPVQFRSFSTEPKEISCNNIRPKFQTPLDSTTAFYFCSDRSKHMPYLNPLSEKLPNLEILQLLLPDGPAPSPHQFSTTPSTWESLTTLIITSSVLSCFADDARKRPLLPSLTTLILTNVFASFSLRELNNIKDVVKTLRSLEIRNVSPSVKPSELRTLIDWMECLHTVTLRRASVQATVKALSITPAKPIKRLVVEGTVLEEVEAHGYTALLLDGSYSVSGDSK